MQIKFLLADKLHYRQGTVYPLLILENKNVKDLIFKFFIFQNLCWTFFYVKGQYEQILVYTDIGLWT